MRRILHSNLCFHNFIRSIKKQNLKLVSVVVLAIVLQSFSYNTFAQNLTVTGKIVDEKGEGIPGASVMVKGTTQGTAANFEGVYTLNDVPANASLIYSFIGMLAQEIPVENRTVIDVVLAPDLIGLDEVVVVGYGTQRKADLTGAVSTLNSEEMITIAVPNVTSTLAGKMTGVITRQTSGKPGGDSPSFTIRGKSTFNNNDALVLVDGIERDFNRIDPNDIESITILKDAASAAVYGARGANGVVLVTTKRGSNSKPEINYTGSFTSATPTFMPEYMSAGNYAKYLNEALTNEGQPARFTDEEVLGYQDGTLPGTDWWSEVMRKSAPMQQHSLSVNGGTEKTKYFMSFGYLNQKGLYETASYKRYNVRSNIDTKIAKNLSVNLDLATRKDETSESTISDDIMWQTLQTADPTLPAYVPEELRAEGDEYGFNYNGTKDSPIGQALHSGTNVYGTTFLETKMGAKYDFPFLKGLSAKVDYSYDLLFKRSKVWNVPYTLNTYNYGDSEVTSTMPSISNINLYEEYENKSRVTRQASLHYENTFGIHKVEALFLYEDMKYRKDDIEAYREQYVSDAIPYLFAGSDLNKNNNGRPDASANRGYVGRFSYNLKEKYLFQVNGRYDGSSKFASGQQWGFFPAFSVGWRISEESFMEGLDFISNLKIRGSWGKFGNDKVAANQWASGYEYSYGGVFGDSYSYYNGIQPSTAANPLITWETAVNSNIGIDFGILDGKISGEFDYFQKNTVDILMGRDGTIPETSGYSSSNLPDENIGEVHNHGIEAIIRYQDDFGEIKFKSEGNITWATSEVIEMAEALEVEDRVKRTGRPFDSRFGYTAVGLFQTQEEIDNWAIQDGNNNNSIKPGDIKYEDYNGDGVIDSYDEHYIGRGSTPELVFGLNLSAEYKKFALGLNFQGASLYGRYLYLDSFDKSYNGYQVLEDSWREGNEGAAFPRLEEGRGYNNNGGWNGRTSTFWLHDGFYVKLRNASLSYTFSDMPFLETLNIQQITLSATGTNLLTIAKKDGFDPEGTDNRYPIMRTVSVGLNVTF